MVTQEMKIAEIVGRWPETIEVFFDFGLGCVGCASAAFETVEDGGMKHGFSEKEIEELVNSLNAMILRKPKKETPKAKKTTKKVVKKKAK